MFETLLEGMLFQHIRKHLIIPADWQNLKDNFDNLRS
jgi:hypothetical protein